MLSSYSRRDTPDNASDDSLLSRSARSPDLQTLVLVTALDARVRLGTHEAHRITFANMAFADDRGVQRQAAAESAANIAKDLGIALERIGIKSIEGLSGMREYGTAVPGSGSAIDRFSTAENTSRSEVLCQPEVRADPEHRGEGLDQFPIDPDLETASEKVFKASRRTSSSRYF